MKIQKKWHCLLVMSGLVFWWGQQAYGAGLYDKLVEASKAEMAKKGGKLKMSLDWPKRDTKKVLPAFKKQYPFIKEISYTRERGIGPFGRYLIKFKQGEPPPYDIMHIASEFQAQYWKEGAFIKPHFGYKELNKDVPEGWPKLDPRAMDPAGNFLSTTGNARGNIYNPKLVPKGKKPTTWEACLDPMWKGNVLLDTRNKLQAFQHDPKTREAHLNWLRAMVKNGVVLTRGQGSIVRKVASGEFPVACGINYHTANRNIDKGVKNLKYVQPAPRYPLEIGSRIYVAKWSKTPATTQLWALWISTGGQDVLEKYAYRGFPWDPKSKKYPSARGKYLAICGAECARKWDNYNGEYREILGLPAAKKKKR
ncbi:MAG: ABC transporter substrate-binding protein [Candidatus Binatia bacterium]